MEGVDAEVCDLGFASQDADTKELKIQALGYADGSFDETTVMSQLGVTAMPYPATPEGAAQGIIIKGAAGYDGICVGANDTRSAKIVGNLKPGDTVVHSTGPQQAAQLQLKEEKRQCALVTKNKAKKDFGLFIDGKAESVTLTLPQGGTLQLSMEHHGMTLSSPNGKAFIQITDEMISFVAPKIVIGGRTPTAPVLFSLVPVTGTSGVGTPAPGVFVGV